MISKPYLFVLTGGPGAGKTTLLNELERRGLRTVPEVARQIIQEQVASNGTALPWADREAYTELMLQRSVCSFQNESGPGAAICDRGIPDTLCYARLCGLNEKAAADASATYRYAGTVFLAPAWQEIYTSDAERRQDFAEAVRTSELMLSIYQECGYNVLEIPRVDVVQRADFVLTHLKTISDVKVASL
ncbi:AAA family ATPase [Terriglobus sp. RCC_193]|uniref:AAA family ATPase n=1 Tax=Terriglobus sp. RCC_193 TaxID=3239218 RepID=UPI003523C854